MVKIVQNFSPVKTLHYMLQGKLTTARMIMDATCGQGYDCLYLTQGMDESAELVAFDIQQAALELTRTLLEEHGLADRVRLYNDSFVNFERYINQPLDLVVFNLGYLPGTNKKITTGVADLQSTLPRLLNMLNLNGVIGIVSYRGHSEGLTEYLWLQDYLSQLNNKIYNVGRYELFNHTKAAPVVYIIERIKEWSVYERS